MAEKLVVDPAGKRYCGSQWAHKPHIWYDKAGTERTCAGATTSDKPNKGEPQRRG